MGFREYMIKLLGGAPSPGTFYSGGAGSIPVAGPLAFPGWPDRTGREPLTPIGQAQLAMSSAWAFSDIQYIAREASTAALTIQEVTAGSEKAEQVINHPFELLWRRPNPFFGRSALMQQAITQLLTSGELYQFFAPAGNELAEQWIIPSWAMRPEAHAEQFISGYLWQPRTDKPPVRINPEYICYTRLPNPFDMRRGLSPLKAALMGIQTDLGQAAWNKNFFTEENAQAASIVSLPRETNNTDFLRFQAELKEYYGSGQRRTMVTRGGEIEWKTIQGLQKDMEFMAGRGFSRDEIDRVFGFPSGFWVANATEANQRGAKAVVVETAVWPLLTLIAEDVTTQILSRWYGDQFESSFEDIRPRNIELDLRERQANESTWTINELRKEQGKEPLDDCLWDDVPAVVALRIYKSEEEKAPPPPGNIAPQQLDTLVARNDALEDTDTAPEEPDEHVEMMAKWERKAIKALRAGRSAAVKFETDVVSDDDHDRISDALAAATTADAVREAFKAQILTDIERALADRLGPLFSRWGDQSLRAIQSSAALNYALLDAGLMSILLPFIIDHALAQMTAFAEEIGPDFDPATMATTASAWANTYTFDLVTKLTSDTRTVVQNAIAAYLKTPGMTREALEKLLRPAFGLVRAEMIAITETTRAAAQAATMYQTFLAESGLTFTRINRTNADDRVCAICGPLNGKAEADWPNEQGPPWHTRCRCAVTLQKVAT